MNALSTWRAALVAAALTLGAAPAMAQSGFYLPSVSTSSGQDEFRAADGTTCRSTMDGTKRVEVGTYANGGRGDPYGNYGLSGYNTSTQSNSSAGVYGRLTVSLDASPSRIDCNRLYKLEIERRELELEIMKRSMTSADRRLDDQMSAAPASDGDAYGANQPPSAVRVAGRPVPAPVAPVRSASSGKAVAYSSAAAARPAAPKATATATKKPAASSGARVATKFPPP